MLIDNGAFPGRDMGAFKYYISMFVGTGVRSLNADTADAGKGGWGVSARLLTLGLGGVGLERKKICGLNADFFPEHGDKSNV